MGQVYEPKEVLEHEDVRNKKEASQENNEPVAKIIAGEELPIINEKDDRQSEVKNAVINDNENRENKDLSNGTQGVEKTRNDCAQVSMEVTFTIFNVRISYCGIYFGALAVPFTH